MRVGYAAIAGRPNVGKSTLLNALVGARLSAVSRRPQTTRLRVLGIDSGPEHQIVLLDTPGLLKPAYALQRMMLKQARDAIGQADVLLFLVEAAAAMDDQDRKLLQAYSRVPALVAINKIDLVEKETLLGMIADVNRLTGCQEIYPISALREFGIDELRRGLASHLPEGQPLYDPDLLTDQPERFFAAEIIREKIFERFGAEIPYATAVVIEDFREQEGRKDVIRAVIWVEKASQKPMLIGRGGAKLKDIGSSARRDIERFLDRPVYLELWVKVREKWRKKDADLRELGF